MTAPGEIRKLSEEIRKSSELLTVLGDEMRQHLILVMMESGMRVNDIAAKTFLSRPAVSHHLQILKDAGIIATPGAGFGPAGEGYIRFSAFGGAQDAHKARERISALKL